MSVCVCVCVSACASVCLCVIQSKCHINSRPGLTSTHSGGHDSQHCHISLHFTSVGDLDLVVDPIAVGDLLS